MAMRMIPEALYILIVAGFMLGCLVLDVRTGRIPNWLTVPIFLLGLAFHTIMGGLSGLGFALLGFLTGFGLLFVLLFLGGGGGGDVKMMGALGAWLGAKMILGTFIASAVVAGLVLVAAIVGGDLTPALLARLRRDSPPGKKKEKTKGPGRVRKRLGQRVPYGISAAIATWLVLAYAWKTGGLSEIVFH